MGEEPSSRAKSTPASVCPSRASTPPSLARRGKMWPGRWKSVAPASGFASRALVLARSAALILVVMPFFWVGGGRGQ